MHIIGYSCFTVLCYFPLYNEVNQLSGYIHRLPLGHSSHPSGSSEPRAELPALARSSPLALCLSQGCVYLSIPASQYIPHFHHIHTFVLYSRPVNRFISSGNIKCLQENTGRTLFDINHSKIFFDPPPRVMKIKTITKGTQLNSKTFAWHRKS